MQQQKKIVSVLFSGCVIEHRTRWIQLSSSIVLSGIFTALIPWSTNLWVELAISLLNGFTTGFAFPGQVLIMIYFQVVFDIRCTKLENSSSFFLIKVTILSNQNQDILFPHSYHWCATSLQVDEP